MIAATVARRSMCTAVLLFALGAALHPGLRAADQQQMWRMSDPGPFCQLLLRRWQAFGEPASPGSVSHRFVDSLTAHKENVQTVIARADSIPTAAEELDRLTVQFAEKAASSGMIVPRSLSLSDPGSYFDLFKSYHDFPDVTKIFEEWSRSKIQDILSRTRFRSREDRDNFVASRLCQIVNLYLDMLDNEQERQIDWGQLIGE